MSGSRGRPRGPGGAPLIEKREQFVSLISRGVGTVEACRQVGVNRRTGHRGRHGRRFATPSGEVRDYPAVKLSPARRRPSVASFNATRTTTFGTGRTLRTHAPGDEGPVPDSGESPQTKGCARESRIY